MGMLHSYVQCPFNADDTCIVIYGWLVYGRIGMLNSVKATLY